MNYLKLFPNHTAYSINAENDFLFPNVSYCEQENELHYNKKNELFKRAKDAYGFDVEFATVSCVINVGSNQSSYYLLVLCKIGSDAPEDMVLIKDGSTNNSNFSGSYTCGVTPLTRVKDFTYGNGYVNASIDMTSPVISKVMSVSSEEKILYDDFLVRVIS